MVDISTHYDLLILNNNDPLNDSKELQSYMDKWDGDVFIKQLSLKKSKKVLEVGCGTGRILNKIFNNYFSYTGIDISPLTIEKARERFNYKNINFICDDISKYQFNETFNLIYSTLTFMHIKEKEKIIKKVYSLLDKNGVFVLSIDKNQNKIIDTGYSKIKVYPDTKENIATLLSKVGFDKILINETEFAYIISAKRTKLM